jgi:uncharacterized protein
LKKQDFGRFAGFPPGISSDLTRMTWKPNLVAGSTRVDLAGLTEGTHPLVLDGGEGDLELDPGVELRAFRFEGTLSWSDEDRRVRGFLHGKVVSACDRCLAPFPRELAIDVDAGIDVPDASRGEVGEGAEETVRVSVDDASIDLAPVFLSAVLLDQPMKNVCREDCRGLCPACGTNRNESACDCDSSRRDPRWDALKGLSTEKEEK